MIWLLMIAGFGIILELSVFALRKQSAQRVVALVAMFALALFAIALLAWRVDLFAVVVGLLSVYRVVNLARVVKGRMHQQRLRRQASRTSLVLIGTQLVVAGLWAAWIAWHQTGYAVWAAVAGVQLVVAAVSLTSLIRTIRRTQWPGLAPHIADADLPTLTVAVPARNETNDLQHCLQRLIASDYPKLEIIVLDDCSQTKRTPEIIRSFAHAGVRFVQGGEPGQHWLPKNWAYHRLAKEASGQYILFCGVDMRFEPHSLRQLMYTLIHRQKQMLCLLPERALASYGTVSLLQAMRYWWELVPPRRLFDRPPVLSSCWLVRRSLLHKAGGFAAVAGSITPEAHFAKAAIAQADSYSFVRATHDLGITSTKSLHDQYATATRVRYPQVHRRPEQVAFHSLAEITFLLLPFGLSIAGFWINIGAVAHWLAFATCLILVATHELVVLSTRINTWWFGLVAPPLMIAADVYMLHYSMLRYEFGTVNWRDRNICIPVMGSSQRIVASSK